MVVVKLYTIEKLYEGTLRVTISKIYGFVYLVSNNNVWMVNCTLKMITNTNEY